MGRFKWLASITWQEKEKLRTQDTPEAWIKEGGFSFEKSPPLPPARFELGTYKDISPPSRS